MSLEQRFSSEKAAVARLLKGIFGADSARIESVAKRLEVELADQIRYDHREVQADVLAAQWGASGSIAGFATQAASGRPAAKELQGLVLATYAFRLMTLAHVLEGIGAGDKDDLSAVLSELGLGLKEVEAYRVDFVK